MTNKSVASVFIRKEYRKHFINNFFPIATLAIVFISLFWGIILLSSYMSKPMNANIRMINAYNYDYVLKTPVESTNYREIYKFDNLVTFANGNKQTNVNTYLHLPNAKPTITTYDDLKSDEVVISEQIAKKLHLNVGDRVTIYLPIYDQPVDYTIAKIIPYISNFYDIQESFDFSVAMLGYNSKFEKQINGSYVMLLSEQEYQNIMVQEYQYIEIYDLRAEKNELNTKIWFITNVTLLFIFILTFAYYFISHKHITEEVIKYYNDVIGVDAVKVIYYLDHLLWILAPTIIASTITVLISLSETFVCGLIILIICEIVAAFIGGKQFGKAD